MRTYAIITMHINTPVFREQTMHQFQSLVDHCDKTICTFAPSIAISNFFYNRRLFGKTFFIITITNFYIHRKIRPNIKRRVNVNQFQTALRFYFFTKWSIFERGKNEFIVSPNQFIRPSGYLSSRCIKKRILIAKFCITSRLVYLLNNLKRQDNIRYLICLSIPKKLNFSVIIKEQETVLFRKRVSRL